MQRTRVQVIRLLDLIARIRKADKEPVNCLILSTEWEVAQKTVHRDIDFLRDQLHAPIEYNKERKTYYFTEPTWSLPALLVSEGEILAMLLGTRVLEQYRGTPVASQLSHIFGKLAELLPGKVQIRPEDLFNRFSFRGPPAKPLVPEIWTMVVKAVCEQKTLRLKYRPANPETFVADKEVEVNPYHIANLQGEWYLFGAYAGHEQIRQFSLARIEQGVVTDQTFAMPPAFDPGRLLEDTFGRFAGENEAHTVQLRFTKEVARWVEECEWHPKQTTTRLASGEVELSFPAKGLFEVKRWVLSWGPHVQVLAPPALQEDVAHDIRQMAQRLEG
jgi:predicted DNA-binding transcriptional regulator YafY